MQAMQRIHILRAGTHTDANGVNLTFTEADLAASAAAYRPELHEAPFVVGHPKDDGPAYGWAQSLAAKGRDLFVTPAQVNAEFAEQVEAGAYKKVSAAFYGPTHPRNPAPGVWYLRHVGFLGAMPPAIKGLRAVAFAEDAELLTEIELEYSEQPTTAETPEPSSLPPETEAQHPGTGVSPEGSTMPPPEPTVTPEEKAALEARNTQLQAELDAARSTLQAQAAAANTAAHTAFAEALVSEARITPDDKALLIAALDHLEPAVLPGAQAQVVEFGEGDAKKPMATALMDWLKALPKRVEFSEQASRERAAQTEKPADTVQYAEGTPAETIALDQKIRAYAAEHKLSYSDAATFVARG